MSTQSREAIGELAADVSVRFRGSALGTVASSVADRLAEPLRLAIAGRAKAGKSTLLNAIVGEPLAPTDAGECTRVVTWYRHGHSRGAVVEAIDGTRREVRLERGPDAVLVELGCPASEVRRLEITWPSSRLQAVTLIDTPGIGSVDRSAGGRAVSLLADRDGEQAVDAVVYLADQVHPADWHFLEAFTDDAGLEPDPSCAVAVVSRADEVAGAPADAIDQARAAAARMASDPAVRRHCQSVLTVSALLAAGSVSLTIDDHRALVALAGDPTVDDALRTASRFVGPTAVGGLTDGARRALLRRLGLFGVRSAVTLLRAEPACTSSHLVAWLRDRSGLDELLAVVEHQFLRRRDALRRRGVIQTMWAAALAHGPGAEDVLASLERIEATDHELAELQTLAEWRAGGLALRAADGADLERWLDPPAADGVSRAELLAAIERWRRLAEHPLTTASHAVAAHVVARAVERRLTASPVLPEP